MFMNKGFATRRKNISTKFENERCLVRFTTKLKGKFEVANDTLNGRKNSLRSLQLMTATLPRRCSKFSVCFSKSNFLSVSPLLCVLRRIHSRPKEASLFNVFKPAKARRDYPSFRQSRDTQFETKNVPSHRA